MTKLTLSLTANALLVLVFVFLAFKRYEFQHQSPPPKPSDTYNIMRSDVQGALPASSKDILFVGNSLTEGFPVTELFGPNVKNRGIGGNTTEEIMERISYLAADHPRLIFLEAGINDLHFGASPDSVIRNISRLIDSIRIRSPHTRLYIQSLFPVDEKMDSRWEGLQKMVINTNVKLRELTKAKGVIYLDLFTPLGGNEGLDKSVTADGLHLNHLGYETWEKVVGPLVKQDTNSSQIIR